MQHRQHPYFPRANNVKNAIIETIQIQTADFRKTNGIELCVFGQFLVSTMEFFLKFMTQTGTLVLIPIKGGLQVNSDERMAFESGHFRIL